MNEKIEIRQSLYLGIDIGGTAVKIGSVTECGEIIHAESYPVDFDRYDTPILKTVVESCHIFKEHHSTMKYRGIGVSATGAVNTKTGVIEGAAGHIKNWDKSPIKTTLEQEFHLPVSVLNDANAAAVGEMWKGAAKGKKNVVVITIGTGIGGGIITDGNILLGSSGFAGEVGHIPIQCDGERCSCGNKGCLEHYGSMTALIRMVKKKLGREKTKGIDGKTIFAMAENGNGEVLEALEQWIGYIANGIIGLVHIFNPELVLIGGGVSGQEIRFIAPLENKVRKGVMPEFARNLELRAAELGNRAGMIGAVYSCLQHERALKEKI